MARRMFTEMVTRSDAFLDMPTSTQALYFHLLSEADDDGFVSSPKMVMRIVGANADEIKTLVGKKFLIPFDGGVCVIKHWRMHNQVRKDRYIETKYKNEKLSLFIRGNGAYTTNPVNAVPVPSGYFTVENIETMLLATTWQPTVALGKGRVGQVNISETDVSGSSSLKDKQDVMGNWNKKSDNDDDMVAIDLDTREEIETEESKVERETKELNTKIRANLKIIEPLRGKTWGTGKDMNFHVKAYRELLNSGHTHTGIISAFMEIVESPHWKEEKEKGNYPGMNTVQFHLRNKKPV